MLALATILGGGLRVLLLSVSQIPPGLRAVSRCLGLDMVLNRLTVFTLLWSLMLLFVPLSIR